MVLALAFNLVEKAGPYTFLLETVTHFLPDLRLATTVTEEGFCEEKRTATLSLRVFFLAHRVAETLVEDGGDGDVTFGGAGGDTVRVTVTVPETCTEDNPSTEAASNDQL